MFDAGKQYINEKAQQYQQWATEHLEVNEYVKFAAYSGSAYAGYKGTAAIAAAWAARKAVNNAINERAAANTSKPTPYKAPAAPSANPSAFMLLYCLSVFIAVNLPTINGVLHQTPNYQSAACCPNLAAASTTSCVSPAWAGFRLPAWRIST